MLSTDLTREYPRKLGHLFHHPAAGITLTSAKGPCHNPGSLIQVEQVESVEFVGGFNERGGTEMRVAELSLAYRGAAQRRIRPEAERRPVTRRVDDLIEKSLICPLRVGPAGRKHHWFNPSIANQCLRSFRGSFWAYGSAA